MATPAPAEESGLFHTSEDVARKYRTKPGTVRYWRHIGYGPRGVKVGRRVLYSEAELRRFDAWLAEQVGIKGLA